MRKSLVRDDIVAEARSWVGTPFHWQASRKGVGADCKGLIAGVASALGMEEAQSIYALKADYMSVDVALLREGLSAIFDQATEAQPGDVLLLNIGGKPQHLALLSAPGRMIHTYGKGPRSVIEVPMGTVWKNAIDSIWTWRGI